MATGGMGPRPTLEAVTLLGEFGFEFVAPDQVGEPTPGRIADRLSEIIGAFELAQARSDWDATRRAVDKLKRLQQAIDVWSLLAADPEIETLAASPVNRAAQASPVDAPPSAEPPSHDPALDIERLEVAAAGTQQAFLRAIGQDPDDAP